MDNGKRSATAHTCQGFRRKVSFLFGFSLIFSLNFQIDFLNIAGHLKGLIFFLSPNPAIPEGPSWLRPGLIGTLLFEQEGQKLLDLQGKTHSPRMARCLLFRQSKKNKRYLPLSHLFKSPFSCRTHQQLLRGVTEQLQVASHPRKSQGESHEEVRKPVT